MPGARRAGWSGWVIRVGSAYSLQAGCGLGGSRKQHKWLCSQSDLIAGYLRASSDGKTGPWRTFASTSAMPTFRRSVSKRERTGAATFVCLWCACGAMVCGLLRKRGRDTHHARPFRAELHFADLKRVSRRLRSRTLLFINSTSIFFVYAAAETSGAVSEAAAAVASATAFCAAQASRTASISP